MGKGPAQAVQFEAQNNVDLTASNLGHQAIEPPATTLRPRGRIHHFFHVLPPSALAILAKLLKLAVVRLSIGRDSRVDLNPHDWRPQAASNRA